MICGVFVVLNIFHMIIDIEGYNKSNRPKTESSFDLNLWTWNRKIKYWKDPILTNCI